MGESSQSTNSTQTNVPWQPQADQLTQLYQDADNAYSTSSAVPTYTGQEVATATPTDYATQNAALGYGTGTVNPAITSALQGSTSALNSGLTDSNALLSALSQYAGTNQTGQNIANANQYASGQNIAGQTAAAMNAVNENFTQNVLPQINTTAAATGNMGSTRTGIAQGVATEGLNNNAASIASQLQANAYNSGLNLSNAQSQEQLSALQSGLSGGENLLNSGTTGISNAVNSNATNTSNDSNIIAQLMGYDQAGYNNSLQTMNTLTNQPFASANDLNNIVNLRAASSGTTTGQSTTTTDPSPLSMIGSGLGMLGGMMAK